MLARNFRIIVGAIIFGGVSSAVLGQHLETPPIGEASDPETEPSFVDPGSIDLPPLVEDSPSTPSTIFDSLEPDAEYIDSEEAIIPSFPSEPEGDSEPKPSTDNRWSNPFQSPNAEPLQATNPERLSDDVDMSNAAKERFVVAFEDNRRFVELVGDHIDSTFLKVPVRVQYQHSMGNGKHHFAWKILPQNVDPKADDISSEQKLGVLTHILEMEIAEERKTLMKSEGTSDRKQSLSHLHDLYIDRFTIDTAYQEFKVREIERRARSLRNEVTRRDNACEEWADAMVTLAKMQANGIETMGTREPDQIESRNNFDFPPASANSKTRTNLNPSGFGLQRSN